MQVKRHTIACYKILYNLILKSLQNFLTYVVGCDRRMISKRSESS